jgi:hypothetical protein
VGAFSIDVCLVLIFANILRLNFYIFSRYQFALFVQSIIMTAAQILLLKRCVHFKEPSFKKDSTSEHGLVVQEGNPSTE